MTTVAEERADQRNAPMREPRLWVYAALAGLLVGVAWTVHRVDWFSSPGIFPLSQVAATVLAFVVGALALVRYYSRKRRTYLYIGTGFFGTGFLELYDVLINATATMGDPDLPVWTWIASRTFLSLFLFVSWLVWYLDREEAEKVDERSVYLTAGFLTVVIFLFFTRSPLAQAYQPEWFFSRPAEFIPALLFGAALAGYLWKGRWRTDPFEHWLIIALVISVIQHGGIVVFSSHLYDGAADAAHLLKLASYASVLCGLMASFYVTFQREARASQSIVEANAALAQELQRRREAEQVLQESEEQLQDFLEHAHDLIQSADPQGKIVYANEAWRRTLGYDEEDLEGLTIHEILHPRSRETYEAVLERVFAGESVSDFEVSLVARDGRIIRCSGSSNARFRDGVPVSTRSILRDVTEERRAREELATSQANLEALFESTGDAIWSVDPRHRLITFNPAFALTVEAITGREPRKGDRPEVYMTGEAAPWFTECYDRALGGARFSAIWEEVVDGEDRSFELYFNPIQTGTGTAGVVVFTKDITRRIQVEEALRRAKREAEEGNKAKSQFMANMSHELRTPLNSVIGFANILMKDKDERLEKQQKEFLSRILANGKHLLSLINEILDLSKIEAGRMEVVPETVDLGELVRETVSQLEGQAAGRPVKLRSELPEGLRSFRTDPGKLKQVLINLVGNALKFTEEGSVTIRVEAEDESGEPAAIHVADTGPGIPDDRLGAIFEAFQQVEAGTTRRFGGTGLGLTISRSLCHLLGYHITVESEVGAGSTFSIRFHPSPDGGNVGSEAADEAEGPLQELGPPPPARWAPSPSGDPASGLHGCTVLVVDDEPDSRYLLQHYLEDAGCRVITASDGVEGLDRARRDQPDLITVDLMMPRMSGWELLRAVRDDERLRNIPVVVVSIVAEEGSGEALGAVELLNKPVEREEFLAVLRRHLVQGSGTVLVVEDDPDTRRILQRYLSDAGLVALTAENGRKALELIREKAPDLVLLDLMLPGLDGAQVLQRLRADPHFQDIPVVVLTAKDLSDSESRELGSQALDVILKGSEVEDRLRTVLDRVFGDPTDGEEASASVEAPESTT